MAKAHNYTFVGGYHTEEMYSGRGGHHTFILDGERFGWGGDIYWNDTTHILLTGEQLGWIHHTTMKVRK